MLSLKNVDLTTRIVVVVAAAVEAVEVEAVLARRRRLGPLQKVLAVDEEVLLPECPKNTIKIRIKLTFLVKTL